MPMKEMWDKRYAEEKFLYGTDPNHFFQQEITKLKAARVLLPGDGEGRNAAFAAKNGWQVSAFDYSKEAVKNAEAFLHSQELHANLYQASILDHHLDFEPFDALGLFYLHLPSTDRKKAHKFMADAVKKDGYIIMEVFSNAQLGRKSGGPQNEDMLYTIDEIRNDFTDFEFQQLEELEVGLNEGPLHQGKAMVIRFVGKKKF
jgi:SAM-dependent methyltransferase